MRKLVIIFIFSSFFVNCLAQHERGFQIWNKNEIVIRTWEKISIEVAEKIHYSPEHGAAEVKYLELYLSHKPVNWLKYGAGFRGSKLNTYPEWIQENRPMIFADLLKNHKNFSFKYANRLEYRMFEFDNNHFRYRQEFLVEFPSLADWGMRFYTSEESFIKLNSNGLHLIRFYGGLSVVQIKHFKLKMFYALEKLELIENWRTTDIAGINLSFII